MKDIPPSKMPGKQSGKMQKFVQDKNTAYHGAPQGNATGAKAYLDDLKAEVPKGFAAPNSGQMRSNNQHTGRALQAQAYSQHHVDQPQRLQNSDVHRPFYGTDVSNIDSQSTTASERQMLNARSHATLKKQTNVKAKAPEDYGSEEGSESDYEEGDKEELPLNPLQPNNAQAANEVELDGFQRQMVANMGLQQELKKPRDGRSLPYVRGDSYPETTSGRARVAELNENEIQSSQQQVQAGQQAQHHQRHDSTMRAPLAASHPQSQLPSLTLLDSQNHGVSNNLPLSRPNIELSNAIHDHVPGGFHSRKNDKQKIAMHVRPQQKTPSESMAAETSVSNNTAHCASAPVADNTSNRPLQETQHEPQNSQHDKALSAQHHNFNFRRKGETLASVQQQIIKTAPKCEALLDLEPEVPDDPRTDSHFQESQTELDYNPPELFQMDYKGLKAESFDVDPNTDAFDTSREQSDDTLSSKLKAISAMQPQDQAKFFASLLIADWDEAGDWFLTRFGQILSDLKNTRYEKRKAAKAFENEIESRHGAVSKKRKQTEDELAEMKKNGGMVLQGTPKKAKKTCPR